MADKKSNKYLVSAYDIFNNIHSWEVPTLEKGREYAKRIVTEGLIVDDGTPGVEVFYPSDKVVKVVVKEIE